MNKVTFNPRKNSIVATGSFGDGEVELGFISIGVSQATLNSFKEDMLSRLEVLSTLNGRRDQTTSTDDYELIRGFATLRKDLGYDPENLKLLLDSLQVHFKYPYTDRGTWDLSKPINVAFISGSELLWEGVRSQGIDFERHLSNKLGRYCIPEYREAYLNGMNEVWNNAWNSLEQNFLKNIQFKYSADVSNPAVTLLLMGADVMDLPVVQGPLESGLLLTVCNKLGVSNDPEYIGQLTSVIVNEYSRFLRDNPRTTKKTATSPVKEEISVVTTPTTTTAPLSDNEFVNHLLLLPVELSTRLLGKTRFGANTLHRRYQGKTLPDVVTVVAGRKYATIKYSGDMKKTANLLVESYANKEGIKVTESLRIVFQYLVRWLLKYTHPVSSGSTYCNWHDVFRIELPERDYALVKTLLPEEGVVEIPSETTEVNSQSDVGTSIEGESVPQVVVGFQTKPAIAKMDVLPKGTDFAVKNWPWFFDESGKFDLLQLCHKGDRFSVMAKCKPKGRNTNCVKRTEIDIDTTYVSVRNAVITAYAAAVIGTGIENYPTVEELFKEYCDAFTVAALTELNLNGILPKKDSQKVSSELVPTYLNFQDALDPEQILEKLTYPSGRLRVVSVGKSTEGVFWYVKANKIGMGPSIKPKRVRFTEKQLDEQINKLTDEIKRLTNLPDNPSLIFEVKSILYREANRVKHGLI